MYNPREDLFEGDEDDSNLIRINGTLEPRSSEASSGPTCLSYSAFATRSVFEDLDDEIFFPSYEDDPNKESNDSSDGRTNILESLTGSPLTVPEPTPMERSEDDSAARIQPSRHVDYLSHDWTEEDIWSSWKYIVSKRKTYTNSERLENASWRSWEKRRRNLKTVSPDTLKWLKDHDVTWLYGPLQPGSRTLDRKLRTYDNCNASTSNSGLQNKKSILKKWSLSELMLRRSLSPVPVLGQAAMTAEVHSTQKSRKLSAENYDSLIFDTPGLTRAKTTALQSLSTHSSFFPTPDNGSWVSKSVRFHESVEQCIALSHSGDDEPEHHCVSDSDDEVVVIKRILKPKKGPKQRLPPIELKKGAVSQTIETLPHIPLKYPLEAEHDKSLACEAGLGISQCSAQEGTSPSSRPASRLFRDDSNSDNDDQEYWTPPTWLQNQKDSVQGFHDKLEAIRMHRHRPLLEQRSQETANVSHVTKGSKIEGRDARIAFELPPCRSQLASFSFTSMTKTASPTLSDGNEDEDWWTSPSTLSDSRSDLDTLQVPGLCWAKTAMVDKIMKEFWDLFREQRFTASSEINLSLLSPESNSLDHRDFGRYEEYFNHELPKLVRSVIESRVHGEKTPDEAEIIRDLATIIQDCRGKLASHHQHTDHPLDIEDIFSSRFEHDPISQFKNNDIREHWSPRTSSDSGYGSEERNEEWRVRDTSNDREEKEKGISDWELYADAWDDDEVDEAVAWERGF